LPNYLARREVMHAIDAHGETVADLVSHADRLLWSGDVGGALALLDRAAMLDAPAVERYGVGEALLRASNCARGWDLYDLHPSRSVDRLPDVQRWDGTPCRLLILVAEQGFGDAIQFLRFVPQVAHLADRVVVAVHDELLTTVGGYLPPNVTVIRKSAARATAWPSDTRWERLMSLPVKVDGLRAEAVDAYLSPPVTPPGTWQEPAMETVTVGVAWRSTLRRGLPSRSFPSRFLRQLAIGPVRVVSLHRSTELAAIPSGVATTEINNFVDTAYVISRCDLVVTADTVTAHLAPALGVPTLICLRHRPDWRWGTPKHPTRWYAAADTLFQDESRDWGTVLAEACRRVRQYTDQLHSKGKP
jgi:hypothetical protein